MVRLWVAGLGTAVLVSLAPWPGHAIAAGRSALDPGRVPTPSTGAGVQADFNGDGFADLAVGVAKEDVGVTHDAGAVDVIYGSANGVDISAGPGAQQWIQSSPGIPDRSTRNSNFGRFLAVGDFNQDGFGDLAIAAPEKAVKHLKTAGAVDVIYGSLAGLDTSAGPGAQYWTQDSPGILDQVEAYDSFGFGLTGADFNGDGYTDLAIDVSYEDLQVSGDAIADAGAVNVIYGSATGLDSNAGPGNQFWNQNSAGMAGDGAEIGDEFAFRSSAQDFNGDGYADLVLGVYLEDVGTVVDGGAVNVIYGSVNGLDTAATPGSQFWTQDSDGILDQSETSDIFGRAVSAGDFNGDGYADLAIGAMLEDLEGPPLVLDAGSVNVIYGSADGLDAGADPGNQFWTEDSPGIAGDGAQAKEYFGRSLASADFNGSGHEDIGIGAPSEGVGTVPVAGAATVIYGSSTGLDVDAGPGSQYWNEGSPGMAGDGPETLDKFAKVVSNGDYNGDGFADFVVGIPDESLEVPPTIEGTGAADLVYGSAAGLATNSGPGSQFWTQNSTGIGGDGQSETADRFGWAVGGSSAGE